MRLTLVSELAPEAPSIAGLRAAMSPIAAGKGILPINSPGAWQWTISNGPSR